MAALAIAGAATVRSTNRKLRGLAAEQEKTMGQLDDIANAFDASTTAIGIEIGDLKDQLQRSVSAGQAPDPATITRLSNISDRLKAMTGATVTIAGTAQSVGTAPSVGTPTEAAPAVASPPSEPSSDIPTE